MHKKLLIIFFFAIVVFGLVYRVYTLRTVPLHDWDEAIYAQVAREIHLKSPLETSYNAQTWLEKPPLPYTILAIFFIPFGPSDFVARLPALLLGILLIYLVWRLAKRSIVAVLALLSSNFFLDRAALVNVDMYLAVAWTGYFAFIDNVYAKFIFTTVGVWSKSLLGFYPLVLEFIYDCATRKITKRKFLFYVVTVGANLSWYVWGYLRYGQTFIHEHLLDHLVSRVTTPIELHFGGKLYYAQYLWQDLLVLVVFLMLAYGMWVWTVWKSRKIKKADLVYIAPLVFLIFLTLTKAKLYWYLFPLIPLFAVCIGLFVDKLQDKRLRIGAIVIISAFFLYRFVTATFLYSVADYTPPDKTVLAKCMVAKSNEREGIYFLVSPADRRDKQVLEAAQLAIGSSFRYGGSPAFVYHSGRQVMFYYDTDRFTRDLSRGDLIVIDEEDKAYLDKADISVQSMCSAHRWHGYRVL